MNNIPVALVLLTLCTCLSCQPGHKAPTFNNTPPLATLSWQVSATKVITDQDMYGGPLGAPSLIATDSGEFLLAFNPMQQVAEWYDFTNARFLSNFKLDNYRTGLVEAIWVHAPDSLLLYSPDAQRLFWANGAGKLLSAHDLRTAVTSNESEALAYLGSIGRHPMLYNSKQNQAWTYSHAAFNSHQDGRYYEYPTYAIFSLDAEPPTLAFMAVNFPTYFSKGSEYFHNDLQTILLPLFEEDRVLLSLHREHRLFAFSATDGRPLDTVLAKSNFINHFPLMPRGADLQVRDDALTTVGHYAELVHNPHTGHFYRMVYHEQPLLQPNGELNHPVDRPFSLIVLDSALNVLGEALFSGRAYSSFCFIAAKDGLWLNRNEANEDELIFDRIAFNYDH